MPVGKRSIKLQNKKFNESKRGDNVQKVKEASSNLSMPLIAFFLFVVVGSALFQIIQTLFGV
jgi:hypothetical protein